MDLEVLYKLWQSHGTEEAETRAMVQKSFMGLLHSATSIFLEKISIFQDELMMGQPQLDGLIDESVFEACSKLGVSFAPMAMWTKKAFRGRYAANRTFYQVGEIREIFQVVEEKSFTMYVQEGESQLKRMK